MEDYREENYSEESLLDDPDFIPSPSANTESTPSLGHPAPSPSATVLP